MARRIVLIAIWLFALLSLMPWLSAQAAPTACNLKLVELAQTKDVTKRLLSALPQLKVMEFNFENLMQRVGKHTRVNSKEFVRPDQQGRLSLEEEKVRQKAMVVLDSDPDIIVGIEIEGLHIAQHVNDVYLKGKYEPLSIKGNDTRGINIVLFIKKDLPFKFAYETHKDHMKFDKIENEEIKIFSRDLPILYVYLNDRFVGEDATTKTLVEEFRQLTAELSSLTGSREAQPIFFIAGNHAKSQRDRSGDDMSVILRTEQYEAAGEIIDEVRAHFPNLPGIFTGDFNTPVDLKSSQLKALAGKFTDAFDNTDDTVAKEDRVTQTFHPRDGKTVRSQLDAQLITEELKDAVVKAEIYRYKNPDGSVKPIPDSYEEREKNPSDHFPVNVTYDIKEILKARIATLKIQIQEIKNKRGGNGKTQPPKLPKAA